MPNSTRDTAKVDEAKRDVALDAGAQAGLMGTGLVEYARELDACAWHAKSSSYISVRRAEIDSKKAAAVARRERLERRAKHDRHPTLNGPASRGPSTTASRLRAALGFSAFGLLATLALHSWTGLEVEVSAMVALASVALGIAIQPTLTHASTRGASSFRRARRNWQINATFRDEERLEEEGKKLDAEYARLCDVLDGEAAALFYIADHSRTLAVGCLGERGRVSEDCATQRPTYEQAAGLPSAGDRSAWRAAINDDCHEGDENHVS